MGYDEFWHFSSRYHGCQAPNNFNRSQKPWLPIYADNSKLEDCFEDSSMLGQLVEQGKFVFERSNVEIQANTSVVVVLAAGGPLNCLRIIFCHSNLNIPKKSPSIVFLNWST